MNTIGLIIGANLEKKRTEYGMSQQQFSELLGLVMRTYQRYESGERVPPDEVVDSICEKLNIDISDLIFVTPKKAKPSPVVNINLVTKYLHAIPSEIYETAQKFGAEDEVWETVKGVFRSREKALAKAKEKRA